MAVSQRTARGNEQTADGQNFDQAEEDKRAFLLPLIQYIWI
jgi:hypothetical protein